MMKSTKVLLITNIMSPYRVPLFNNIQKASNLELEVTVLAEKEANREWRIAKEGIDFVYSILRGFHKFIWTKEIPIHITWGLSERFRRCKPDSVIISGYDNLAYWKALLHCKLSKRKYIFWNGTTLLSTTEVSGFLGKLKKIMIQGADRYIAYGTKAAEYLVHMGASRERIYTAINTVDMEWFANRVKESYQSRIFQEERAKYPKLLLLYVGQLIGRKGISRLLDALSKARDPDIGLLVVGNGPLARELKRFCQEKGLENVYFEGFQQQTALPRYYALADVLILPSLEEVWGLVVNEALASGLYVLCSERAGVAHDLIKEGWNGKLLAPGDVEALTASILEAKEQIAEIRSRREHISEHACNEFGVERSAKVFLDAIYASRTDIDEEYNTERIETMVY